MNHFMIIAAGEMDICDFSATLRASQIIGNVLLVLKIAIPLVMIITSSMSFAKAVSSSKQDYKESMTQLGIKFIGALLIFLGPTIFNLAFSLVDSIDNVKSAYANCEECIIYPNSSGCKGNITIAEDIEKNSNNGGSYSPITPVTPPGGSGAGTGGSSLNVGDINDGIPVLAVNTASTYQRMYSKNCNNNYYTSKSGLTYCLYNQCDPRWGNEANSRDGQTFCEVGCAVNSVITVATGFGYDVTPSGKGQSASASFLSSYGIQGKGSPTTREGIISWLKTGYPVVVGKNGNGQHFFALVDIDVQNNKVYVANSYGAAKGISAPGWYDIDKFFNEMHGSNIGYAWYFQGNMNPNP